MFSSIIQYISQQANIIQRVSHKIKGYGSHLLRGPIDGGNNQKQVRPTDGPRPKGEYAPLMFDDLTQDGWCTDGAYRPDNLVMRPWTNVQ